jgi:hypothetical protein
MFANDKVKIVMRPLNAVEKWVQCGNRHGSCIGKNEKRNMCPRVSENYSQILRVVF